MRSLALALPLLLLAGCLEDGPAPATSTLEGTVEAHVEAFLAGDADRFLFFVSPQWVDLGGGDGGAYDRGEHRARLQAFFDSTEFRERFAGRDDWSSVLDVANYSARAHDEFMADDEKFGVPDRFAPREDDVQVRVPPLKESPLFDGWFGYYRPEGEGWAMVAGD